MNLKLELKIAGRYLRAKKKEGFASIVSVFSFLGIMLGVATLIVTMAVMNGVKTELVERIIGINTHISLNSADGQIENYRELVENISKIKGVKSVNPAVHGQVLGNYGDNNQGLMVRGIDLKDFQKKTLISDNIKHGQVFSEDGFDVIGGVYLAKNLGLKIGSKIRLITPDFNSTLFGNIPRMKDFTVTGVFDVGMYEYDSSVLFTSLKKAQIFFKKGDSVNVIEIEANNPEDLDYIKQEIFKFMEPNQYLTDWAQANAGFIESINVQSNVLFLILALIILVAAFNIISGMVMLVNDKNKEIAILRTIGLERGSILRIFIICGSAIGVTGTLLGILLGLGFASNIEEIRLWLESLTNTNLFSAEIYFLSKLPAEVRQEDVINISILALVLSLLSTIYPALKASKIEPAVALKYE